MTQHTTTDSDADANATEHEAEPEEEEEETPEYDDPELLERLYHDEGLSQAAIAERFGTNRWRIGELIRKYDLNKYHPDPMKRPATLVKVRPDPVKGPYYRWDDFQSGESLYVAQLIGIAKGADPHDLFGGRARIRIKNGRRDDLRLENVKVEQLADNPWQDRETLKEALADVERMGDLEERWDVSLSTVRNYMHQFGLERHFSPSRGWYVVDTETADSDSDAEAEAEAEA